MSINSLPHSTRSARANSAAAAPLPARRTVINAVARFNPLRERLADARARYELACPR